MFPISLEFNLREVATGLSKGKWQHSVWGRDFLVFWEEEPDKFCFSGFFSPAEGTVTSHGL